MKIRDILNERLEWNTVKNWSVQDWTNWMDERLQDGQVAKADWNDAKSTINRQMENKGRAAQKLYLANQELRDDPASQDLYYSSNAGLHSLNSVEKKANKCPDSDFKTAILGMIEEYKPLRDRMEQLKPMIVTAVQQRDAVKTQQAVQRKAEEGSAAALVNALKENRQGYVDHAKKIAQIQITKWKSELEEKGGAEAFANPPFKLATTDPKAYERAKKAHDRAQWVDKMSEDRWVQMAGKGAEDSYDAWTYKLVQKIGKPVVKADVNGDPWTGSVIQVETNDGENQAWKTQQIINTSKLGKQFYQFPTRRMK